MDWDTITQTGARTSGVEEPTPRMAVHHRVHRPDTERVTRWGHGVHEGQIQTYVKRRTVDRGGGGNGGIIRSPIRATTLPDRFETERRKVNQDKACNNALHAPWLCEITIRQPHVALASL